MKRSIIVGAVIGTVAVAGAGVAWAVLSGVVVVPDAIQGIATGGGANSCQTGAVTFTVPDPTWSNSAGDYTVSTIGYSGINTQCVNLGTADLILNITDGSPTSLANATATNMSSSSGTLTLSTPIPFDDATTGTYRYLVKDQ